MPPVAARDWPDALSARLAEIKHAGFARLGYREKAVPFAYSDALAADEVLLRGLLSESGRVAAFRSVGEMLSFEPYGIMYSHWAEVVDRAL
jgi:hypothetical protein